MGLEIDIKLTRLIFEMKGADEPPLLDQVRGGGYVVALWALLRLHLSLLERARELNEPQFEEVSVISLTRLISIIVHIARLTQRALDDATVHIRHLPLSLCPVLYLSVIAHDHLRSGRSEHDQNIIKGLLVALRNKWELPEPVPPTKPISTSCLTSRFLRLLAEEKMSKVLVVFGATGQQGGSVVETVLSDPQLSSQYHIRTLTRDPSKPAAQKLAQKGVEVLQGDLDDVATLERLFRGANAVFAVTETVHDEQTKARDYARGKALVDAASAAGVEFYIYSTLPAIAKISNNRFKHGEHFDVKAEVEDYIRSLPIRSAFVSPGSFMQNFLGMMAPVPAGDGTYAVSSVVTPETRLPMLDAAADMGKFVAPMLLDPAKYQGRVLHAATKLYSMNEIVKVMTDKSGKVVKYNQLPVDVFKSFMPPLVADRVVDMMLYIQDFGCWGPDTEKILAASVAEAHGKPTTLEEFFDKHGVHLQSGP
ncbi:hypothetical protein CNMCM7691_002304 [Aspergillus felis]|uniref:NmrA-like domain-containing protein n=1 Tax=Aspergillus felis TaxID=1287682 RepID=A0A8H6R194_9EURO|nr:hypothetical protein CNMCM7691_002304 [Aspergillus felis]